MTARVLAVVSTAPPIRCGLATYSEDLIGALRSADPHLQVQRANILSVAGPRPWNSEYLIRRHIPSSYVSAAEMFRERGVSVALLQHEFKIFGGRDGCFVLDLIDAAPCPVVTTLHTVSRSLRGRRVRILLQICRRSAAVVVHSPGPREVLRKLGIDEGKIVVIPHGAPAVSFRDPPERPNGAPIFVSYGHLRRSKGYELAIESLAALYKEGLQFEYLICGKDHPRRRSAASYREELQALIRRNGLER